MIYTVLGPINPEEIGITMSHEHLLLDLSRVRKNTDSTFDDFELIVREVNKAIDLGVKTMVEVTCNDMGRDVLGLKKLSEITGLNIIASTGFYLDDYHSNELRAMSVEEIAAIFEKELTIGIDNTGIKAGVIGEVASSKEMSASEEKVLLAAGLAASKVGCAVTTHCQLGLLALEQIALLTKYNMAKDKIILGHLDLANDLDYYVEILKTGVNIGFDTVGKEVYLLDDLRAKNIKALIELGYVNQIVLSQDVSRLSYLDECGEHAGYKTVMESFVPLLKTYDISDQDINKMLIDNPKRIFSF